MNIFQKCFKEDGKYLIELSGICQNVAMSDYIGSDIGMIIQTLKILGSPINKKAGIDLRSKVLHQYNDIINPILHDMWLSCFELDDIVRVRRNHRAHIILYRISTFDIARILSDKNKAVCLALILGVLSSTPSLRKEHLYDGFLLPKIQKILHVIKSGKTDNYVYSLIKTMIQELSLLSYGESTCDRDFIDTGVLIASVAILINILYSNTKLDISISKIIFQDDTLLSKRLIDVFSRE